MSEHTSFCALPLDHQSVCLDENGINLTAINPDFDEPKDPRVAIPEQFYALIQEALRDLYAKCVQEGGELMDAHKAGTVPTALYRIAHEAHEERSGRVLLVNQWFSKGFKIAEPVSMDLGKAVSAIV